MLIAELRYPGTWLDGLPREQGWEAQQLLQLMQGALNEAAIALHLFQDARDADLGEPRGPEAWEAESAERQVVEQELRAAHPPTHQRSDGWWEFEEKLRELVEQEMKRRAWQTGRWPRRYQHALPFLHAKAFLYSLDAIAKTLQVLVDQPWAPAGVQTVWAAWTVAFPHLQEVRNTSHHQEDRVRRLGKGGKPLDMKPLDNSFISAPGGGVLVLNSLNGNRYGCTMADGHYGEVEVSDRSLLSAAHLLQRVLDTFDWRGSARYEPS